MAKNLSKNSSLISTRKGLRKVNDPKKHYPLIKGSFSSGVKKSILLVLFFIFSMGQPAVSQSDSFLKDFAERWETSRHYLVAIAEAMPESDYGFKPSPEEMSFAAQLMHVAWVMDWHGFSKIDGQEYPPKLKEFKPDGRSKEEIIAAVNREFDRAAKLIADFDPERMEETGTYGQFTRTRRQFFLLMADHVAHHRGQLVVYLRLKDIVPPQYTEFQ